MRNICKLPLKIQQQVNVRYHGEPTIVDAEGMLIAVVRNQALAELIVNAVHGESVHRKIYKRLAKISEYLETWKTFGATLRIHFSDSMRKQIKREVAASRKALGGV